MGLRGVALARAGEGQASMIAARAARVLRRLLLGEARRKSGRRRLARAAACAAATAAALAWAAPATAAPPKSYKVVPLAGPNVACVNSVANINDEGYVVGEAEFNGYVAGEDPNFAFLWHNGTFTQLPSATVHAPGAGEGSCAETTRGNTYPYEITNSRAVLGAEFGAGERRVIWPNLVLEPTSAPTPVTSSCPTESDYTPEALNSDGEIVGRVSYEMRGSPSLWTVGVPCPSPEGFEPDDAAVLQKANGAAFEMLYPEGASSKTVKGTCGTASGAYAGNAVAINEPNELKAGEAGEVLIAAEVPSSAATECDVSEERGTTKEWFLWQKGKPMVELPPKFDPPTADSPANVLNNPGAVIGDTASEPTKAEYYSPEEKDVVTLKPADGLPEAYATAISNHGSIVGYSAASHDTSPVATLWPRATAGPPELGPTDLNSLIPPESGVRLLRATSINNRDDMIAYAETIATHQFEWVAVEPSAGISGRVTASNGSPLAGQQVELTGTDSNTMTPIHEQRRPMKTATTVSSWKRANIRSRRCSRPTARRAGLP